MKKLTKIWLLISILIFFTSANAEQDLPIVIEEGNITYQSQLNYITAFESKAKKIVWKTVLYEDLEPEKYIPGLEQDVQWIVIEVLKIEGLYIKAIDSKKRVYFVNKITGKLEDEI